ncbi:MAG: sodium:solute symporter [Planctomycetota bacterium]|nr:sodium:solute symporter [Planctomycetota bacterium]
MNLAISTIDAVIVIAYLGAAVLFGMWIGRGQRDLSGYLLGGRDLPWWAILGSIVATETSTATFLSVPGIAFAAGGDLRFLQLAMGYIGGRVVVSLVLLPHYFRGNLFTAYEVLEQRFGGATKQTSSLLFLVARNLGDGLRLFLAGIALEKVLGVDLHVCIVLIGLVTIGYTFFGGMKAVVWSDCIQFVVYIIGGLVAGVILIRALPGGWQEFTSFAQETGRLRIFDLRLQSTADFHILTEPFTFWSGLFGGAVLTLGTHGTDQMMVQRYLCARSQPDAARALVLSGVVVLLQFTLFLLLGVGLACFYAQVSPETTFDRNDEVFATFIVEHLPVGLIGITLAAVFAAAMSTLSSSLNSSATAVLNDLYLPRVGSDLSAGQLLNTSRRFTILFGLLQIGIGIGASYLSDSVVSNALAIAGFTAGILLGVFGLGVLTRRVNQTGAFAGMVTGVVVLTIVKFMTPVAWPWYAIIGAIATYGTGLLYSLFDPQIALPEMMMTEQQDEM